mgnify:CR=1 FL=1
MDLTSIIKKIKEKKELEGISDLVIKGNLLKYKKKHSVNIEKLSNQDLKIIIKDIRSELRFFVGQYQFKVKGRRKILDRDNSDELLKTHSSTSERLDFYPSLKKIISDLKIKSILDLGCGLNPLALSQKNIEYLASDINEKELSIIQEYFKKNNINGKTFVYDLRNISNDLPKTDLTILFKVLDVVSKNDRKLSEKIILNISSRYLLVSFSIKKISGKPMNFPERRWFEKILLRNKLRYKKFYSENEVYYLIFLNKS